MYDHQTKQNPGATLICERVPKTAFVCERKELLAAVAAEDQILSTDFDMHFFIVPPSFNASHGQTKVMNRI